MKFCKTRRSNFVNICQTFHLSILLLPYFGKMTHEPTLPVQVAANSTD